MTGVQEPHDLPLLFLADGLVLQVYMLQLGQRTEKLHHVSMTKDGKMGQADAAKRSELPRAAVTAASWQCKGYYEATLAKSLTAYALGLGSIRIFFFNGTFHKRVCHPCKGAVLIFSVLFRF